MTKRKVFGIGETVLDIIFKNNEPIGAKAGGSVLNSLISLARTGEEVYFISETGQDKVGDVIVSFLEENRVNCQYMYRYSDGQSPLALAFLNERNDASYEFYKPYPPQRTILLPDDINANDIVLVASFFAINPLMRPYIQSLLTQAQEAGAIIYYDPNFRASHANDVNIMDAIYENMNMADIVRGSDEDFINIVKCADPETVYNKVKHLCNILIQTQNADGVSFFTPLLSSHLPVEPLTPVSTIGAGDNFNAGFIKGLIDLEVNLHNLHHLDMKQWETLLRYGIAFAAEVCMSLDNYISNDAARQLPGMIQKTINQ
jgi:fructokinase